MPLQSSSASSFVCRVLRDGDGSAAAFAAFASAFAAFASSFAFASSAAFAARSFRCR